MNFTLSYRIIITTTTLLLLLKTHQLSAHEKGAPFSGAIIDPLKTHHAHIENEQRFNFFYRKLLMDENGISRNVAFNSIELATDWTGKFKFGSEVFIPFSNAGINKNQYGIGDIEFWPVKYSFIRKPETILSGILNLTLPTGNKAKGLGEGITKIGGFLFFDKAYRNWFLGINAEESSNISDFNNTDIELSDVISYSFIHETNKAMAPSLPDQSLVASLSFETTYAATLNSGKNKEFNLRPGITVWFIKSGWQLRTGIEIPTATNAKNNMGYYFQLSNHITWKKMFSSKTKMN